jgi:hypothetical protein
MQSSSGLSVSEVHYITYAMGREYFSSGVHIIPLPPPEIRCDKAGGRDLLIKLVCMADQYHDGNYIDVWLCR